MLKTLEVHNIYTFLVEDWFSSIVKFEILSRVFIERGMSRSAIFSYGFMILDCLPKQIESLALFSRVKKRATSV